MLCHLLIFDIVSILMQYFFNIFNLHFSLYYWSVQPCDRYITSHLILIPSHLLAIDLGFNIGLIYQMLLTTWIYIFLSNKANAKYKLGIELALASLFSAYRKQLHYFLNTLVCSKGIDLFTKNRSHVMLKVKTFQPSV